MPVNSTWRETKLNIPSETTFQHEFKDTTPNHIFINNNSSSPLYIGLNRNTNNNNYDMIVPAYGTKLLARDNGTKSIFLYHEHPETVRVVIQSVFKDFDPASVPQTQEISSVAAGGVLGVVDVDEIQSELPAGTQKIGGVYIDEFSASLPSGNNNIGAVDVDSLPSIPAGSENIGSVDVDTMPEVDINSLPSLPSGNNVIGKTEAGNNTKSWSSQTTTDDFEKLDANWQKRNTKDGTIVIENTGDNEGEYEVLGSVDNGSTFPVTIDSGTISAGENEIIELTRYYTDIEIRIKAASAGSQTDIEAKGAAIAA